MAMDASVSAISGFEQEGRKCRMPATGSRLLEILCGHLLKHVSPLSWEHINLTGIYTWDAEHQMPEGFRSLRLPARLRHAA